MKKRTIYSWGAAIVIFVVLMIVTPTIPQSQAYHDFADQRTFFGNFSSFSHHHHLLLGFYLTIHQSQGSRMLWTSSPTSLSSSSASSASSSAFTQTITSDSGQSISTSSIFFLVNKTDFKNWIFLCMENSLRGEKLGWACFFVGVAAVAFGSSYYHLHPDDARLVWDRLPVWLFPLLCLSLSLSLAGVYFVFGVDDYCIHIHHCYICDREDWWAQGHLLHRPFASRWPC